MLWPLLFMVAAAVLAWLIFWPSPQVARGKAARIAAAQTDVAAIAGAVSQFQLDVGRLPTNAEGLAVLIQQDRLPPNAHKYLKLPPIDPWRRSYRYQLQADGINFTISSNGPDGIPGNSEDIVLDSSVK